MTIKSNTGNGSAPGDPRDTRQWHTRGEDVSAAMGAAAPSIGRGAAGQHPGMRSRLWASGVAPAPEAFQKQTSLWTIVNKTPKSMKTLQLLIKKNLQKQKNQMKTTKRNLQKMRGAHILSPIVRAGKRPLQVGQAVLEHSGSQGLGCRGGSEPPNQHKGRWDPSLLHQKL